jgi:hypothetical protein
MSIAAFPIAEPAIAEPGGASRGKRPPLSRQIVPKPDVKPAPEAR